MDGPPATISSNPSPSRSATRGAAPVTCQSTGQPLFSGYPTAELESENGVMQHAIAKRAVPKSRRRRALSWADLIDCSFQPLRCTRSKNRPPLDPTYCVDRHRPLCRSAQYQVPVVGCHLHRSRHPDRCRSLSIDSPRRKRSICDVSRPAASGGEARRHRDPTCAGHQRRAPSRASE